MMHTLTVFARAAFICALGVVGQAQGAEPAKAPAAKVAAQTSVAAPYKLVEDTTQQVLAIVQRTQKAQHKDMAAFNAEVTAVMDKVIDFDGFARGVMGQYVSAQRYKALKTDAERAAFNERIERFSRTFKQDLINTYAKSLLKFSGEKIETLPPKKGDDPSAGTATVMQTIYGAMEKRYAVQYSMRRSAAGEWKLLNVIVEGINLGQSYRNQFAESAERNHEDLEKVIADWRVSPNASESEADPK